MSEHYSGHDPARGCGAMLLVALAVSLIAIGFALCRFLS